MVAFFRRHALTFEIKTGLGSQVNEHGKHRKHTVDGDQKGNVRAGTQKDPQPC